jgi:hypothetical protein
MVTGQKEEKILVSANDNRKVTRIASVHCKLTVQLKKTLTTINIVPG